MSRHTYLINKWRNEMNNGTSCLFTSQDRDLWVEKIREIIRKPEPHYCRFVVFDDRTYFSYAETEDAWDGMCRSGFIMKPLQVIIGIPDSIAKGG